MNDFMLLAGLRILVSIGGQGGFSPEQEISLVCAHAIATSLTDFEKGGGNEGRLYPIGRVRCLERESSVIVKLSPEDRRVRGGGAIYELSPDGRTIVEIRPQR